MSHSTARARPLWPHGANMMLGAWLLSGPATLGYRSAALTASDLISGVLLLVLSTLALWSRRAWLSWPIAGVGIWLMSAPLIFWAPTAAAYNNGTLIGALVVAFAVLMPGTPGAKAETGPETPPGWSYNPSAWSHRAPIVALALAGFFISRYMAAFQLGHIETVWEPFFSPGTRRILESDVSKAFPVSDAGLGALSYLMDALAGLIGGARRWRTMPWMVVLFGLFIIPPGVVSIVLVILQPVAVGTWCTLCLIAAVAMLLMVPPALDEVIATGQLLLRNWRAGNGFWRTFWKGETTERMKDEGGSMKEGEAEAVASSFSLQPSSFRELASGMVIFAMPWHLWLSAAIGVWLMAAPEVLGMRGAAATSDYIAGALVVTFAVIAGAEPARILRYFNAAGGAWLLAAPFLLSGSTPAATWSNIFAGLALILLSLPRRKVKERYGGWERFIA